MDFDRRTESIHQALSTFLPELRGEVLGKMAKVFDHVTFPRGAELMRQMEPGDAMYIIQRGLVSVQRFPFDNFLLPPRLLAELGVGEIVGEMSLLFNQPRNASVFAETDGVETGMLSRDNWRRFQIDYPICAEKIRLVAEERRG